MFLNRRHFVHVDRTHRKNNIDQLDKNVNYHLEEYSIFGQITEWVVCCGFSWLFIWIGWGFSEMRVRWLSEMIFCVSSWRCLDCLQIVVNFLIKIHRNESLWDSVVDIWEERPFQRGDRSTGWLSEKKPLVLDNSYLIAPDGGASIGRSEEHSFNQWSSIAHNIAYPFALF